MPRLAALLEIALGPRHPEERLFDWLYRELRAAIVERRLPAGDRLPSTRDLARQMRIARGTVVAVFEQLAAEGYVHGRHGSGTVVAPSLPDDLLTTPARAAGGVHGDSVCSEGGESGRGRRRLSAQGERFAASQSFLPAGPPDIGRAFRPHQPALDAFPLPLWNRVSARVARRTDRRLLGHGPAFGYRPLRDAIAAAVALSRGVACDADHVAIVTGTHQALDLVARLVVDPGDPVWIEDPAYPGARAVLAGLGARLVGVRVDGEGLDVGSGAELAPDARLAYVTPSHQCPVGAVLSLSRRLALLQWADRAGAWIFEDDYDGEFRYAGRPLVALAGLDRAGRVIYAATFSKTLFPALRLGFVVLPDRLVEPFERILSRTALHAPIVPQMVLAEFIDGGHYGRHLRQMRTLYGHRREVLVDAVRRRLGGLVSLPSGEAGLEAIGWLPSAADDRGIARAAATRGIELRGLSAYAVAAPPPPGLVLGFAAIGDDAIRSGVARLAEVLDRGAGYA